LISVEAGWPLPNTFTAKRMPDGGLKRYVSYINIIADFMSQERLKN
jgi:hypothetical protein